LQKKAKKKKIRSYIFTIASIKDFIRLKEIAYKNRKLVSDAQDLEFLKNLGVLRTPAFGARSTPHPT